MRSGEEDKDQRAKCRTPHHTTPHHTFLLLHVAQGGLDELPRVPPVPHNGVVPHFSALVHVHGDHGRALDARPAHVQRVLHHVHLREGPAVSEVRLLVGDEMFAV